jgi:hypothetical protein
MTGTTTGLMQALTGQPLAPQAVSEGAMRGYAERVGYGPYWARTSDLRLVEPALSQLS